MRMDITHVSGRSKRNGSCRLILAPYHKQRRADFDHNVEVEEVSDHYGLTDVDPWATAKAKMQLPV
jgi:hypothetical protein